MPDWVLTTIVLAYAGIVILLALAAVFSETTDRRTAAYKVLLVMLPSGVFVLAVQLAMNHFTLGA